MNERKRKKLQQMQQTLDRIRAKSYPGWALMARIAESVVPILKPVRRRGSLLERVGSGVLLGIEKHIFLCTAAHVMDHFGSRELYIPIAGRLRPILGASQCLRPREPGFGADQIDAAVMDIWGAEREALSQVCLPAWQMWVDRVPPRMGLLVHGHPIRRHKVSVLPILTEGRTKEDYDKRGLSPQLHILMQWKKRAIGPHGLMSTPDLRGISGGGVWMYPDLAEAPFPRDNPTPLPRLLGIITSIDKRANIMIATRIVAHLEAMCSIDPSLREVVAKGVQEDEERAKHRRT